MGILVILKFSTMLFCLSNTKERDEAILFSNINQGNNHARNSGSLHCLAIQFRHLGGGWVDAGTGFNCQFQVMKILSEVFLLT